MKHLILSAALAVTPVLSAAAPAAAPAAGDTIYAYLTRDGGTFKAPIFAEESENLPVATVEDESITLRELMKAIGAAHGADVASKKAGAKDFAPILDRLVNARLLAREARQMGVAELPEHRKSVEALRESTATTLLQARVLKGVGPDAAEVDRIYKRTVREWQVRSVLIPNREDLKAFQAQLKAGKKFDALAKQLVESKKAKGGEAPVFIGPTNALPTVSAALENMKVGAVSEPVKVEGGFAVMRLEGMRYPENAKARDEAREASLSIRRKAAVKKYYDELVKKHAKPNRALLKTLDFEAAKPGMAALKKDKRVLAQIEGGTPITVADLAVALEAGFYHGVEGAIKEKRVNSQKESVFDGLVSKQLLPAEVKRQKIEETTEFKERVADGETSLLFAKFVEKAIIPQLKLGDPDLRKYYEAHKKEFTYPAFYKLESMAFTSLKAAEAAVKQLRGGTDYKWLSANAEGQVKPGDRKLAVEGTLSANGIPKALADLLAGTKKDDYRLFADEENKQYFAIHVQDVIGATEQSFDSVKEKLQQPVFQEALTAAVQDWAAKLRKNAQVKILITRIGS